MVPLEISANARKGDISTTDNGHLLRFFQCGKAAHRGVSLSMILSFWSILSILSDCNYFSHHVFDGGEQDAVNEERELIFEPQKGTLYHWPQNFHLLNDRTVRLSPFVHRPWLERFYYIDYKKEQRENSSCTPIPEIDEPKLKLILTDLGWNHPNQTYGLSLPRWIRSRELLQGILDHPLFDPTVQWSDWAGYASSESRNVNKYDPAVRYYVFMDMETCFESNYPGYGLGGNEDTSHGRQSMHMGMLPCYTPWSCGKVHEILQQMDAPPLSNLNMTLVWINCRGDGIGPKWRNQNPHPKLSVVSVSSAAEHQHPQYDMGLPPPAVKPFVLPYERQYNILHNCKDEVLRKYLFTFIGRAVDRSMWETRQKIISLHNGKDIFAMHRWTFVKQFPEMNFNEIMLQSIFSGAPRGDNLFSYRFTEVLSGGGIPVVTADNWILPFSRELVDWDECVVLVPEMNTSNIPEVLREITPKQVCERRRRCYQIYRKYMANAEGTIRGIVEGLEARKQKKSGTEGY